MGPKKKKKKARKKLTPLDKIKKQLDKLEALHVKEEAIIDNINEIIEDQEDINMPEYADAGWEGTDPD
jgi:hypothetical protein